MQILRQSGKPRSWQKTFNQKTLTINSTLDNTLFGTLSLKIDSKGNHFVLDSGDLTIKKFGPDGRFLIAYGHGKGQGPGEFVSLTDFASDSKGDVWAADLSNGRITVFASGGQITKTIKMETQPYRLGVGSNSGYFVMFALVNDRLFGRFDSTDQLVGSFGTFLENQDVNAMLLDGWIEPDFNGGFVYTAFYAGLLAAYDSNGTLRFLVETIDRPPLPRMVKGSGRIWVDREAPITAHSLSVTPEGIHILTTTPEGLKQRGVIDTYSLDDGRYLFSRRLPEACRSVKLTSTHLYTIHDTSITQWSLGEG